MVEGKFFLRLHICFLLKKTLIYPSQQRVVTLVNRMRGTIKQKSLISSEITSNIPLRPRAGGSPAAKPGAPNRTRFALPASHHHLDVLPLLLFLLGGGIRLGRHDGTLEKRPGTGAGWDAHLPSRVLARRGKSTESVRRPRSPLRVLTGPGVSPAPAGAVESLNLRSAKRPENGETTRRLNLKKEASPPANCRAGAQGTMGRRCRHQSPTLGAWSAGK